MSKSDVGWKIGLAAGICYLLSAVALAAVPDGYIVKVESSTVYLDWGKASGVAGGDEFNVFREGAPLKHPMTGEILGHEQVDVSQGLIEHVEEKFSTGKLTQNESSVKAGDRTRHVETAPPVPVVPSAQVPAPSASAAVPVEIWRSETFKHQAVGLAIGDVDGDGKPELVVAYRDQIEVFKSDGQKPVSLAVFKTRSYGNYLAVDTADVDGAGHQKIFASYYIEGIKRAGTVILEYASGSLHPVGKLSGFVRTFSHPDGKTDVILQDLSLARELRVRQPELVIKKDNKIAEGPVVKLARSLNNDQLFGFAWGDWDGDGKEDFAFLQNGERLRVFFDGTKWSSDDAYGGTTADFNWEDDQMGSVYPRLVTVKTGAGKPQLLIPHNIQYTPIRLARLKIYKQAELYDLGWNGLEMHPNWKIPVSGELIDFGVGDVLGKGAPQVWIAAVNSGEQTILIGYTLP